MSVMGSQLEIDMDPEGDLTVVPRHVGNTGTGCYKLHDHRIAAAKTKANMYVAPLSTGAIAGNGTLSCIDRKTKIKTKENSQFQ